MCSTETCAGGPAPAAGRGDQRRPVRRSAGGVRAASARRRGQARGVRRVLVSWPAAGLSTSLYLKELYVADTARRTGVATALMRGLYTIAAERGCSRVEWTTDEGNEAGEGVLRGTRGEAAAVEDLLPRRGRCPQLSAPGGSQANRTQHRRLSESLLGRSGRAVWHTQQR